MQIKELMTADVASTLPRTSVARAARLMWDHDCGVLPVVDTLGHLTGIITDRDICRAVTTNARPASRISVAEIASSPVFSVQLNDDVDVALHAMKAHQVRRLPVVDDQGHLRGIVSMNDLVLHSGWPGGIREMAIVEALKGISAHKHVHAA